MCVKCPGVILGYGNSQPPGCNRIVNASYHKMQRELLKITHLGPSFDNYIISKFQSKPEKLISGTGVVVLCFLSLLVLEHMLFDNRCTLCGDYALSWISPHLFYRAPVLNLSICILKMPLQRQWCYLCDEFHFIHCRLILTGHLKNKVHLTL